MIYKGRLGSRKVMTRIALISFFLTLVFLALGKAELIIAWWIMILCLLPAIILVQGSSFVSLKVAVWLAFISQAVTMPMFYLRPEAYQFQSHRPFGFTGFEALPVFLPLGIFLLALLASAALLSSLFKLAPRRLIRRPINSAAGFFTEGLAYLSSNNPQSLAGKAGSPLATLAIVSTVILMLPLNSWMFQMGIGLTGVTPPLLPFRLSGGLTYFATYLVPFLLAYLYIRTSRRSLLIVLVLGAYSAFLGVSTVSRGAALLVILAPLAYSIIDRRWALLFTSILLASFSLFVTTFSRNVVFVVYSGSSFGDTSLGVIGTLLHAISLFEWDAFLLIIPFIIGRLLSFQGLFMASQFDPGAVGGALNIFIKVLHRSLIDLGHDAMHIEMRGHTVTSGFYMGLSGFYGNGIAAINESLAYLPLFSLLGAIVLVTQELAIRRIAVKYSLIPVLTAPIIVLFSLKYIVSAGWPIGNYLLIALLVIAFIPRIKLFAGLIQFVGMGRR